jgi:GrpB-like predicted nucleotidyltransferase (UPF0157 family)
VDEPLVVVSYDPRWPGTFELLRDRASAALRDLEVTIEHVGSTAVPGLAGKPVIDLDVAVHSADEIDVALDRLEAVGYRRDARKFEVPDGLVAPLWPEGEQRHHLYIVVAQSGRSHERILFRDYLRTHSEVARRYGDVKQRLAQKFSDDWVAYNDAKSTTVAEILQAAKREGRTQREHHQHAQHCQPL